MNNTQIDDAQKIDVAMRMYNLIEYSDAYLGQYYRDEPALDNNENFVDFPDNNNPFKFKQKTTGEAGNGSTKDVEVIVPLKYLSSFWRTLEMPWINCEFSLQLKWSRNCIIVTGTANHQNPNFETNDTRLFITVVTLSTQEDIKHLKKLESGFKRAINCN